MKTKFHYLFIALALLAGFGLLPTGRVTAQTFTNLHSFTTTHFKSSGVYTNSDGAYPAAGLILSGNTLYGTASGGGTNGNGTVFAVNTDGTGFTVLHTFTATRSHYLYQQRRSQSGCRIALIGHHPVWDGGAWRHEWQWHGVLPSTPMASILRTCIVSRHSLLLIIKVERTATGLIRWRD